ncbi:MAG: hypothetical protein RI967_40 [Planctomycetota bacterium]
MRHLATIRLLLVLASALTAFLAPAAPASAQQGCVNATNSCYEANLFAPGCSNPVCCQLVCSVEPACCEIAWDDVCVSIATKFCSDCGEVNESCFVAHPTPSCSNGAVCEAVCIALPECCSIAWDEACVEFAKTLVDECGAPAAGSCLAPHDNPNCADTDCCTTVCTIDPRCCETVWDESCVRWAERYCFTCGNPRAGSCCHENQTPYCDDRACCEAVCEIDPFCCETRWDFVCGESATTICNLPNCLCGDDSILPGSNRSCRVVHPAPGCNDAICCNDVCYVDAFCCGVTWDTTCVQTASSICAFNPDPEINQICSEALGSCFVEHESGGCTDDACCSRVCAADPLCCLERWDADCAARAEILCNGCGELTAGSCFYPHDTPSCLDFQCCDAVCVADPGCCTFSWDIFCVLTAGSTNACQNNTLSCGDARTRPCTVASFVPACKDAQCCNLVCAFDPLCCQRAWDETCAASASINCDNIDAPNCPAPGSPLVVHGNPGCNDVLCCEAVCAVDPICCSFGWSDRCVQVAKTVCSSFGGCPGVGNCDESHTTPGCQDATCCTIVCEIDPFCCEVQWNSTCAGYARDVCVPESDWNCPCIGSCFEEHAETPGCNDETCCAGVCNIDPTCCTEGWDAGCVSLARVNCCGFPGCGDNCAGDCLMPHDGPFCDDPSCCEAVCRFEPYCCEVRWDSSCVQAALLTCNGGCGLPVAGSCFSAHFTIGCDNAECCDSVCSQAEFAYCCIIEWDEDCAAEARERCKEFLPECGTPGMPGCNIPHDTPACSDEACCEAICKLDSFCCDEQWDSVCVEMTYTTDRCERYQYECGGVCAGACCEPKLTPWCNDEACCEAICLLDIFCCDTQWDQFCAQEANQNAACDKACPDPECGTPEAGRCCFPHDTANCDDQACCDDVCAIDTTCCEIVWDSICAAIANAECAVCEGGLSCGSDKAGSCCNEHAEPFCDNAKCCAIVCSFDEACCQIEWDTTCVKLAQAFCGCN